MQKKPLGQTIWFKVFLTVLVFIPSYAQQPYDPANTTDVIAAVMASPIIASVSWLLPIAKLMLLAAVVLPILYDRFAHRFLLGYYALILFFVGILQNMSFTEEYGFVWIIGNNLVLFAVLIICFIDVIKNRTKIARDNLVKGRLWIAIPMLLAFLMPYSIDSANKIVPSFTLSVLVNEAGVTYCMITPVVIGIMLLFSREVHKPTLSLVSYVGLLFGLLNMVTWFGVQFNNWWMGILHLPLVILSLYGLLVANKKTAA